MQIIRITEHSSSGSSTGRGRAAPAEERAPAVDDGNGSKGPTGIVEQMKIEEDNTD